MTLPEWCNTQWIIEETDQGYGRIKMPSDVNTSDIQAHLVCGSVNDPVASWSYEASALVTSCNEPDCGVNTQFVSYSIDAPAGTYQCAYRYEFGPQTIACMAKTQNNDGGAPVVLDATTKLTADQTLSLTVLPASTNEPTWCYFKHLDESSLMAYGRILLPEPTTPAQMKAMLICGDFNTDASTWTAYSGKHNIFCSDCGPNTEFAVDASSLPSGTHSCAFRFDISGKSYVCPTYHEGIKTGGIPIELTSGKRLNRVGEVVVENEPVSVWDVTVH